MENATQLTLPLFEPPGFDDLLKRQQATRLLSVTVNRRLKRGWQVKFLPVQGPRRLIIPSYLETAPEEIKNALIEWALLPYPRRRAQKQMVRKQRAALEKIIWSHIASLSVAPGKTPRFDVAALAGKTRGVRYDLQEIFTSVNSAYFNGSLRAVVRWGQEASRTSYHTKKTDTHGIRIDLVTIAGIYNHPDVPRFALEGIMYHEMLHIAIPPVNKNGRHVIHGKDFKAAEEKFLHYHDWRKWELDGLVKIMRRRRRKFWHALTRIGGR
jgi:hypothetical protein